jgi:iron complex transport system substrate-binding protein
MRGLFFLSSLAFLTGACTNNIKKADSFGTSDIDTIYNKHAKGFNIIENDSCMWVSVFNPWQNASDTKYTYELNEGSLIKKSQIKIPVQRVVCLSTTHLGFIDQLGCSSTIVGVSNPGLVNNETIKTAIKSGLVADIGYDAALDFELIIKLKPDVVFAYSVGPEIAPLQAKLADFGIPVIMVAEYLEESALAKAEWIKFFGCFYQKNEVANSCFKYEEYCYDSIKATVSLSAQKPLVLTGFPWKDVWYVPGSNSYMARLIEDAGGTFLFSSLPGRESQPLAIEYICQQAGNAQIWINAGVANQMSDIANSDPRLQNLPPFIDQLVFNNNKRQTPDGGNDFFESGVVFPHLILKDLIAIFQNPNADTIQLYYYQKLK